MNSVTANFHFQDAPVSIKVLELDTSTFTLKINPGDDFSGATIFYHHKDASAIADALEQAVRVARELAPKCGAVDKDGYAKSPCIRTPGHTDTKAHDTPAHKWHEAVGEWTFEASEPETQCCH